MNVMTVDGYSAKIEYDPETDMFRGEILGLNGGADFYGRNPKELRAEFKRSLAVFLDVCTGTRESSLVAATPASSISESRRSSTSESPSRRRPRARASTPLPRRLWPSASQPEALQYRGGAISSSCSSP